MDSWETVTTPFDHAKAWFAKNLVCSEYKKGCSGRIMQCMHDGGHIIP